MQTFQLLLTGIAKTTPYTNKIERKDFKYLTVEYILEGTGFLKINSFSCKPQRGDVYFLHKKSDHLFYQNKNNPWEKIFFIADGLLCTQLLEEYNLSEVYHIPQFLEKDLFFVMHDLYKSKDPFMHNKAAVIFHELLTRLSLSREKTGQTYPKDVLLAKDFINSNIHESISLTDICSAANKSKPQLIRKFKKITGRTPYDYLITKRIEHAKVLLLNTNTPIKEIAEQLKFSDEYYFSNFFKEKEGVTPFKFRKGTM